MISIEMVNKYLEYVKDGALILFFLPLVIFCAILLFPLALSGWLFGKIDDYFCRKGK